MHRTRGLGVVFLNERLHPNTLAGVLIIFTGLVVIDGRLARWFRRTNKS